MKDRVRTLQRRVLETIQRYRLWNPGDTVCVAVSGGVDSTVLLHLLHRTRGAHGGELAVCSINHGLRSESVDEVASVGVVARELGVPFHAVELDLKPGANLAERAREARRLALTGVGADVVATGHHQDDQAETVLYHMLRGSGMTGLSGMQPRSGSWVRPLLFEPRTTLLQWAIAQDLAWVEDPSNPASQRGSLRRLMPQLDSVQGGSGRALARSARLLAREDHWLSELAEQAWQELYDAEGLNRKALAELHPALQLRLLRRLVGDRSVRAEPLESIVTGALEQQGSIDLGRGLTIVCIDGRLRVES
jgi:tRNA(Ile)-lysidine synthase